MSYWYDPLVNKKEEVLFGYRVGTNSLSGKCYN